MGGATLPEGSRVECKAIRRTLTAGFATCSPREHATTGAGPVRAIGAAAISVVGIGGGTRVGGTHRIPRRKGLWPLRRGGAEHRGQGGLHLPSATVPAGPVPVEIPLAIAEPVTQPVADLAVQPAG